MMRLNKRSPFGLRQVASLIVPGLVALAFLALSVGPSAAAPKELKIGALVCMSTQEGIEIQRWLDLFAKMYNEKGGWQIGGEKYLVKPVVQDCGNRDVSKTRAAAERAVLQDGVKYIVPTWREVSEETLTVTEPNSALWMGHPSPTTLFCQNSST